MKFSWIATKRSFLANGGDVFGSDSEGAICPRALCQQFSHVTLSTTSLWSRHGCSSKARSERRLGTETVGAERCNLSLASACDPSQGVRRLQQPRPLWEYHIIIYVLSLWGYCLQKPASEENYASFLEQRGCKSYDTIHALWMFAECTPWNL